ncbi:MAG TPA: stage III sporulation protein AD [Bacillota bacterium]|jgi:stage III sporulation protein AD|nr:stage III sporulation protein AD [Bacillota bacterium]HNY68666.1 stage III sporulation protein AD [Bacillota bacterium]HPU74711.1 stage III sporulation protein AD [Bacillota bacterium]
MLIAQVIGVALLGCALLSLLRSARSDVAVAVSVSLGVVLLVLVMSRLADFITAILGMASTAGVNRLYLDTVLRVVGVAYLAAFGAQVCRDAGEGALAVKVELAGKVLILGMAAPLMFALLDTVLQVLPQ